MIESGDIHLADVNQEQRLRVLVVSSSKFTALFAIDLPRSIPVDRLLERVGRVSPSVAGQPGNNRTSTDRFGAPASLRSVVARTPSARCSAVSASSTAT